MSQCKLLTLCVLGLLLLGGCGTLASSVNPAGDNLGPAIAATPVPTGVDPALWGQLTAELERVVTARPRSASIAGAQGRGSQVLDLDVYPDINALCNWTYRCQGDYDLNGEANISDLTPIAVHFGKRSTDPDWQIHQVADGDTNGEVNIADVTPLGSNLGARVAGYVVQQKMSGADDFSNIGFEPLEPAVANSGVFPEYIASVPASPDALYRVVPSATATAPYQLGIPSNEALYTGAREEQPWNQYGGNAQRTWLSRDSGPWEANNVWTLELEGVCMDEAGPVADDAGVVYCTSAVIDFEQYPDLSGSTGYVWAINRDGGVKWRFQVDGALLQQPILMTDRTVVVVTYTHELIALYPDGKLRWRTQLTNGDSWPAHLTYAWYTGVYAIDAGPNLRQVDYRGVIMDTELLGDPETNIAPVIAENWLFYPGDGDSKIYAHTLTTGALSGTTLLGGSFDKGMLANLAGGDLWVNVNAGNVYMQGVPILGGAKTDYTTTNRVWNIPALDKDGNVVLGEIVDGIDFNTYTGRIVGLNDSGTVNWQRPLAMIPTGSMACDNGGQVFCGAIEDDNSAAVFYCLDPQHDIAYEVPVNGTPMGISIAAHGYAVGVHTASLESAFGNSFLVGIDSF